MILKRKKNKKRKVNQKRVQKEIIKMRKLKMNLKN